MKKLASILILLLGAPAFGQEVPPPPPPQDTTYTLSFQPAGAMLQFVDQTGGTQVSVGDDVSTQVSLGFDFTYFGNTYNSVWVSSNGFISFTDSYHGCCGGYLEGGSPNTIYAYWADLYSETTFFKTYDLNGQTVFTAGWYNVSELGNPTNLHNFEITLYSGTNDFSIVYGNNIQPTYPYSAGYLGPTGEVYTIQSYSLDQTAISNTTYSFSLAAAPPPPEMLYWYRIAGENELFTLDTTSQIRYGADGVYSTLTLQAGTYDCSNSLFGDPIGGVVKSCEIGLTSIPEVPEIAVDCALYPTDPTCVIQDLTDFTSTEDSEMLAGIEEVNEEDDNTQVDEVAALEEELLAEELSAVDEGVKELEQVMESSTSVAAIANEQVSTQLSDSIDTKTMESALSVADAAVSVAMGSASESSAGGGGGSSSSRSSETATAAMDGGQISINEAQEQNIDFGMVEDLTGFERPAMAGNTGSTGSDSEIVETTTEREDTSLASAVVVAGGQQQETPVVETDTTFMDGSVPVDNTGAVIVADFSGTDTQNFTGEPVTEEENFVANLLEAGRNPTEQKFEDESQQQEATTIAFDPVLASANAFNVTPNVMNLEAAGVLNQRVEEKSDAEIRAEQAVAANKEEQDSISQNYMDADQSGIVAAIGADVDVSSYRSTMIPDANQWYKPEDIYKNVTYRDNARGMYFLEKGSTDTYKKMVEEQYK